MIKILHTSTENMQFIPVNKIYLPNFVNHRIITKGEFPQGYKNM